MQLIDTHCHIHEILGPDTGEEDVASRWRKKDITDADTVIEAAQADGVAKMICIGTTVEDSQLATEFVSSRPATWASIGIHPHEAKRYVHDQPALDHFAALASRDKVVAIGECGLDYYYTHSQPDDQAAILRFQIELALRHDVPMVFHVRDAFDDFWPIFDQYPGIRGVIHSFTATPAVLEQILQRHLYVGLNGIMTFTKDEQQRAAARAIPLERLVLETDAPFLTPAPYRGTICEPKHVKVTAAFLADLRGEDLAQLAEQTTANAEDLFRLR